MSTHAAVGIVRADGFEGRYVHSDGYPTWVGRVVWAAVHRFDTPQIGVDVLEQFLFEGLGVKGISCIRDDEFLINMKLTGWHHSEPDDGNVRVYNRPDDPTEPAYTDCSDVPWAYALSHKGMAVWTGTYPGTGLVAFVPFGGPEPDWAEIEAKGEELANG